MNSKSRDAIRSMLNETFPEVERIYMNSVPDNFKRPSFYLEFVFGRMSNLTQHIVEKRVMWQIVYFGPKDEMQNVDNLSLLSVLSKLEEVFGTSAALTDPSGSVFHVEEFEGGKRDNELYVTLTLTAEMTKEIAEHELMGDIANEVSIEKEG